VRAITTPATIARTSLHHAVARLKEVTLRRPGVQPVTAVVPESLPLPDVLRELEEAVEDLPRRDVAAGKGAIDVFLERRDGGQVKDGTVIAEGLGAVRALREDPVTRRFHLDGLPAGRYTLRAASAGAGRRTVDFEIRAGDVTRAVVRLDGTKTRGKATLRIPLSGTSAGEVKVKVADRNDGKTVFDGIAKIFDGRVVLENLPLGKLHLDFDDGSAKSCYDVDADDGSLIDLIEIPVLELVPVLRFEPDPPDFAFAGIGDEYREVTRILPDLGIGTMEELAAVEPEALMHRAAALRESGGTPVSSRRFGDAVVAARQALGGLRVQGDVRLPLRLDRGASVERAVLPATHGTLSIQADLPPAAKGTLVIEGAFGRKTERMEGRQTIELELSHEHVASKEPLRIRFTNESAGAVVGQLRVAVPWDRVHTAIVPPPPDPATLIDTIMASLAPKNPGLASVQAKSALAHGNVDAWIDHARTVLHAAGVCSIDELGRFRMKPPQKLSTGLYVAPKRKGLALAAPKHLAAWAFAQTFNDSIHRYVPNEVLHETAVVLAGEWDIRGQVMVIASDVRELLVIARKILHDAATRITWEEPVLSGPSAYWPNPAPIGFNGPNWGCNGGDGADGDQSPHPSKNGGANAVVSAPTVTMWVLDSTNNLPPIDLGGQRGGTGGSGQDGGRGGDGHQGRRADGHWLFGCCRGVGWGGNGGRGGRGGRGGKGGRGAEGGAITILTSAESLAVFATEPPTIDVRPGEGGAGGPGATGGPGGSGGAAGTADCEAWCDEHPERRGADGAVGENGTVGLPGESGQPVPSDAIQFIPITETQWEQEFNQPHILTVTPLVARPGDTIQISGANFDPSIDLVYFDGFAQGPVASAAAASFTVPTTSEGGFHPVVVRPLGVTDRRSNKVLIQILPVLDAIPAGTRWVENQSVTLTGLAIRPGAQVIAEDWSATPVKSFVLPVLGSTRTSIQVEVPGGPLGDLRGVRRIKIRNPDGGESREERVARISDTIVVRCAAFRVVGSTAGSGTMRSATEIEHLFTEGALDSVSVPWAQARISFRLVQPVQDVVVTDDLANIWPILDMTEDQNIYGTAGIDGALNLFFVRDVESSTAYMYFGGGPAFVGDESGTKLGPVDWQQVVAHEIGHGLCLRHICNGAGESPGTFFDRGCEDGDEAYLMYPFWDTADGMQIHTGQVDPARSSGTHFESGKTAALAAANLFNGNNTTAQCQNPDTQN
jgi:hypothetical protein